MRLTATLLVSAVLAGLQLPGTAQERPALTATAIDDIALLLKLEDTRVFDEAALTRLAASAHPEVRRRAVVSIGRIADPRGVPLLDRARGDENAEVAAGAVFALGQLKQPAAVAWLADALESARTPPAVAREAAQALGKIRSPEALSVLASYLASAPAGASPMVVGEALLAIGRFTTPSDVAPIARWGASPSVEVRWRAAWALFRPRNPAALAHLSKMLADESGEVRFWAVRGFTPTAVDAAGLARTGITTRLRALVNSDPDRRVRTEALRVLLQYDDETAFGSLVNALYSPDSWISVSAAEAAGRFASRARVLAPLLVDVAEPKDPLSMKITVMPALVTLVPEATATLELATSLVRTDSAAARTAGLQALNRLGEAGRARLEDLAADPALAGRIPAPQARGAGAGRAAGAGGAGRRGGGAGARGAQAPRPARPDVEYRQLVERWIVPAYEGRPAPRVIWDTPRGSIEIELYPGDAPFGVEHLFKVIESGDIVGTEFTRLVPNFVAQQQAIRNASTLRDEVSRHGLTRANLSWASAGLDTGRPGYTLGHTPQPHNEGDFTALGRVVSGMDAVDRLEIGDKVTAARIK